MFHVNTFLLYYPYILYMIITNNFTLSLPGPSKAFLRQRLFSVRT